MIKEIGSDFWSDGPIRQDSVFLLSGRTALEYILCDIQKSSKVTSALLPGYCCHTMIEPFVRHGIPVRFYDVYAATDGLCADVPEVQEGEIFYYMTYFGFGRMGGLDPEEMRRAGAILLEDKTHSCLCTPGQVQADYSYTSFRKWTGFDAVALAEKAGGAFAELPMQVNKEYCTMRRRAAQLKREYLAEGKGEKQTYLDLFNQAEALLERDYVGYAPMADTVAAFATFDWSFARRQRRSNAEILLAGLQDVPQIRPIFKELTAEDAPLFVPVTVAEGRGDLRKHLIDRQIYCPIHWPLSPYHEGVGEKTKALYATELSLVCDQRYGAEDMCRLVQAVKDFYKEEEK